MMKKYLGLALATSLIFAQQATARATAQAPQKNQGEGVDVLLGLEGVDLWAKEHRGMLAKNETTTQQYKPSPELIKLKEQLRVKINKETKTFKEGLTDGQLAAYGQILALKTMSIHPWLTNQEKNQIDEQIKKIETEVELPKYH